MTNEQWELILDALNNTQDAGPNGEGWLSDELREAIAALEVLRETQAE